MKKNEILDVFEKLIIKYCYDPIYPPIAIYTKAKQEGRITKLNRTQIELFTSLSKDQLAQYEYMQYIKIRDVLMAFFDIFKENKAKFKIMYRDLDDTEYIDLTEDLDIVRQHILDDNIIAKYTKNKEEFLKIMELKRKYY